MDFTIGKVLPPGFAEQAERLASQVRSAAGSAGAEGAQNAQGPLAGQLSGLVPETGSVAATGSAGNPMESFAHLLQQALQDVNQIHHAADDGAARLAAGEEVDVHQVLIGMEKANVAFGLTLQVRNKLIEAYQEIMRMQV